MPQCVLHNKKRLVKPIPIGFTEDRTTMVDTCGSFEISKDIMLQVPSFNVNLLSVSQLTKDTNCRIIFNNQSFHIQNRCRISIGTGRRVDGLYILSMATFKPEETTHKALTVHTSTEIWHRRLGHPYNSKFSLVCSPTLPTLRASPPSYRLIFLPLRNKINND